MKTKYIHVTVSGPDHPGITAELMKCLMKSELKIIDMGQSITHGLLSLSFLLDFQKDQESTLEELKQVAKKMKVQLGFEVICEEHKSRRRGDKYILSCVALEGITPGFLFEISTILSSNSINIQRIENVTGLEFKSLEILLTAHAENVHWEKVKAQLLNTSNKYKTDLALLKDNVWRRNKRLIVFDMDSTLIQSEVINEMANLYNQGEAVSEITERAMNGELDFDESLKLRVGLLKGMPESYLEKVLSEIELTEGVEDFVKIVKELGYKLGIISGGFQYFADHFKNKLSLDYAFANHLEIKDGALTGNLVGSIVNAEKKAMLVDMLAQQENINLEQVVAIGDGANDLLMLSKAGLGIAFHAKEVVKQNAKQHMSHGPMTSILYFLGIPGN